MELGGKLYKKDEPTKALLFCHRGFYNEYYEQK